MTTQYNILQNNTNTHKHKQREVIGSRIIVIPCCRPSQSKVTRDATYSATVRFPSRVALGSTRACTVRNGTVSLFFICGGAFCKCLIGTKLSYKHDLTQTEIMPQSFARWLTTAVACQPCLSSNLPIGMNTKNERTKELIGSCFTCLSFIRQLYKLPHLQGPHRNMTLAAQAALC